MRECTLLAARGSCGVATVREYVQDWARPLSTHVLQGCCRSHFNFRRRHKVQDTIALSLRRLGCTARCDGVSASIIAGLQSIRAKWQRRESSGGHVWVLCVSTVPTRAGKASMPGYSALGSSRPPTLIWMDLSQFSCSNFVRCQIVRQNHLVGLIKLIRL